MVECQDLYHRVKQYRRAERLTPTALPLDVSDSDRVASEMRSAHTGRTAKVMTFYRSELLQEGIRRCPRRNQWAEFLLKCETVRWPDQTWPPIWGAAHDALYLGAVIFGLKSLGRTYLKSCRSF
jgi:hypothetical protein